MIILVIYTPNTFPVNSSTIGLSVTHQIAVKRIKPNAYIDFLLSTFTFFIKIREIPKSIVTIIKVIAIINPTPFYLIIFAIASPFVP